jgi:hypothetical protein
MRTAKAYLLLALTAYLCMTIACSKDSAQGSAPNASDQRPAGAPQPSAAPVPTAANKGTPATEKHRLYLTNYSEVPITISLNGEWLGQSDNLRSQESKAIADTPGA